MTSVIASVYLLERNQRIELPIDQIFEFYGDALNRERITPHAHTFEEDGPGATIIRDRVRYSIPFGPLGELADWLLDYRRDAVARELGS